MMNFYYNHHLSFLFFLIIFLSNTHTTFSDPYQSSIGDKNNSTSPSSSSSHRKLLTHRRCTEREISISQSKDRSSGIPKYMVQIANTCVFDSVDSCLPSDIHLHCASFASDRIVNPLTFKRLSFDDCLVNAGRPLRASHVIKFTYSSSFMYPLSLRSVTFC